MKDPKTQAGIKAGDVVESGDKFLQGVELTVKFDTDWNSAVTASAGSASVADGNADDEKTVTVGTADLPIGLTAKDTITITVAVRAMVISLPASSAAMV